MSNRRTLASSQLAVIFLLFLDSTNLAFAKPTSCTDCGNSTANSSSTNVVYYNVQISESGTQYNETIEVDTEKQTELFKVPAHNNVDHSNILHDFKMNLSMLMLPEKKICYLLPLDKELSTPGILISDLDEAQRKTINKKLVIDNKWTVDSELNNRSVLSDELATFCAKYPIYYVKKMEDSMTSTRIQTDGTNHRQRRQLIQNSNNQTVVIPSSYIVIPSSKACIGGKLSVNGTDVENCLPLIWKVDCLVIRSTCYTFDTCDSFGQCLQRHFWNNIICCQYNCQ